MSQTTAIGKMPSIRLESGPFGIRWIHAALAVLALLPLVILHHVGMWESLSSKASFAVYPLLGWYLYRIPKHPHFFWRNWRGWIAFSTFILSLPVALVSFLLHSPYLSQVAFLLVLCHAVATYFPSVPFDRFAKGCLLLSLTAIPSWIGARIESRFVGLVGQATSAALEYFDIAHFANGRGIEVPGLNVDLFLDICGMEAFFGSLLVLFAYWLYVDRGLMTGMVELASIPFIAVSNTVLRIIVLIEMHDRFSWDLSKGSAAVVFHLIALLWCALTTLLVLKWIDLVLYVIPRPTNRDETPLGADAFNRVFHWPLSVKSKKQTKKRKVSESALVQPIAIPEPVSGNETFSVTNPLWKHMVVGGLIVTSVMSLLTLLRWTTRPAVATESPWAERLTADLKRRSDQWVIEPFAGRPEIETRIIGHPLGETSCEWKLTDSDSSLHYAIDFGDPNVLYAPAFFEAAQWKLTPIESTNSSNPSDSEFAIESHDRASKGHLIVRRFNRDGEILSEPNQSDSQSWIPYWDRMVQGPIGVFLPTPPTPSHPGIQLRLLRLSNGELERDLLQQDRELFEKCSSQGAPFALEATKE